MQANDTKNPNNSNEFVFGAFGYLFVDSDYTEGVLTAKIQLSSYQIFYLLHSSRPLLALLIRFQTSWQAAPHSPHSQENVGGILIKVIGNNFLQTVRKDTSE